MRRIVGVIGSIILLIFIFAIVESFSPAGEGLTIGFIQFFVTMFDALFKQDVVLSVVLFLIGALFVGGAIFFSKNAENKLWRIVTAIVSVASYITMFTQCSGGN